MKRRDFLAVAALAAAARRGGSAASRADSGPTVRQTPLRARRFGPLYYDEAEQKELIDVLASRQPFRWYGDGKVTVHPAWPSFASERGRSIRYGAACCPRTSEILARFAGVSLDPKFTRRDTDDIVASIRKVYPAVTRT